LSSYDKELTTTKIIFDYLENNNEEISDEIWNKEAIDRRTDSLWKFYEKIFFTD
jgi:hypothetical protein